MVDLAGSRGIPSFEMMVIRCFFQILNSGGMCWWIGVNPFGESGNRTVPFLRGLFGSLSTGALYYGATHLDIADATVLKFTSPIWTLLLARVLLGERIRLANGFAIALGFLGTLLVSQPQFLLDLFHLGDGVAAEADEGKDTPGTWMYASSIMICLFGAVCSALVYILIRKSGGSVHFHVLGFYYGIVGVPVCSFLLLVMQGLPVIPPDALTYLLLIGIAISGCIAQTCFNKGAQKIEASKTAAFRSTDVAFVLLWQVTLLHDVPSWWSFAGIACVCGCTLIMAFWQPPKPSTDKKDVVSDIEYSEMDHCAAESLLDDESDELPLVAPGMSL